MARSDELKRERDDYYRALQNVTATSRSLAKAISSLRRASSIQSTCYKVNDVSGGSNYLTRLIDYEQSICNNIVNNIIPGIRGKIESLNWRIVAAESEESMEGGGL